MKIKTFIDYLQEQHASFYTGTDDDMPDDFERWLEAQDKEDMMGWANYYGKELQEDTTNE